MEEDNKTKKRIGINFSKSYEKLQSNALVLFFVCLFSFVLMGLVALAVFFINVKGPEEVLVPNVVGKNLETALLELQVKELYPKINLRYSDKPNDEGLILEQNPEAGSIAKGYSRISLVVSRGVIVDKVEDYVGMNINEVQLKIQTLFAGQTRSLIILDNPEYKPDSAEAGTILEQDPPVGTSISEPVTVHLIVSRGPNYENTRTPRVVGMSINDILQTITRSKVIFDINSHVAINNEVAGTVVSQSDLDKEFVPNYSRITLDIALPEKKIDDNIYGIFETILADYPYPVPMRLDAIPSEGDSYTIINFSHSGGRVTIPYSVPENTVLVLYVADKETQRTRID
jgi:eukaryotic-like serine/threonine-protein kinase